MRMRKCEICGKEFDAIRGNQLTCGPECRLIHNREYARANYRKTNPNAKARKPKKDYSKIDAEIRAFESTWGEYSTLKEQGLWEDFKRRKFREICARNNGDTIQEVSWIGGGYHSNKNKAENTMQKLTDYNSRR